MTLMRTGISFAPSKALWKVFTGRPVKAGQSPSRN